MAKRTCPLLQKSCIEHRCAWYVRLVGTNKNTGEAIDEWGCSVAWLPVLMIEQANETRQVGAAVEAARNATVRGEDATRRILMAGLANALPEPPLIEGTGNGRSSKST